jgi:hypothetical protein
MRKWTTIGLQHVDFHTAMVFVFLMCFSSIYSRILSDNLYVYMTELVYRSNEKQKIPHWPNISKIQPTSRRKWGKKSIPLTHIHDRLFSCLGTGTSVIRDEVKSVSWALSAMIRLIDFMMFNATFNNRGGQFYLRRKLEYLRKQSTCRKSLTNYIT